MSFRALSRGKVSLVGNSYMTLSKPSLVVIQAEDILLEEEESCILVHIGGICSYNTEYLTGIFSQIYMLGSPR